MEAQHTNENIAQKETLLKGLERKGLEEKMYSHETVLNVMEEYKSLPSKGVGGEDVQQEAFNYALNKGYPQSDKFSFATYWTQHNIAKKAFLAGAKWQATQDGQEGKIQKAIEKIDYEISEYDRQTDVYNPDKFSLEIHALNKIKSYLSSLKQ